MQQTLPDIDPGAPLFFLVNGASGRNDAQAKRELIEAALKPAGRRSELRIVAQPGELHRVAREAAIAARRCRTALVGVGGDGTLNAVARAAHAEGCAMGVVAQGTFNYFARSHGLPTDPAQAIDTLLRCTPVPVQVATVNGELFLVNASLGLYPELLQDREAYKSRFGRSRWVALLSTLATLVHEHRQLGLHIEQGGAVRRLRTPTLFVGNNRLQLEQVGLPQAQALEAGRLAGVVLRPIGTLAMLWLLLRGAFGKLGDADTVESFEFQRIVVRHWHPFGPRRVMVACDGEVSWMRGPLEFKVSPTPLYLLKPSAHEAASLPDAA